MESDANLIVSIIGKRDRVFGSDVTRNADLTLLVRKGKVHTVGPIKIKN